MAFNEVREAGIPKGRLVPMYLTDEGDLYPVFFKSAEELELVGDMIGLAMERRVAVDINSPINDPEHKLTVYNIKTKKKL